MGSEMCIRDRLVIVAACHIRPFSLILWCLPDTIPQAAASWARHIALLYCAFCRGQTVRTLLIVLLCAWLASCGQQGPLRPAEPDDASATAD